MTSDRDWLTDLLDRHPGAPVPEGFGERVRARLDAEDGVTPREAPILRPSQGWGRRLVSVAAALLLLAGGYWLGQGGPTLQEEVGPGLGEEGVSGPEQELVDMYAMRDLIEDFGTLTDADLEMVFQQEGFDSDRELLVTVED